MKLLKKLKELNKLYFTTSDIRKIENYSGGSLYVVLSRLVDRGELIRLTSGIYILPERYGEVEKIANMLYLPSYLSFESALSKYGIISQIPYTLSFATTRKTRKTALDKYAVEYRQLQFDLYFEYSQRDDGVFIATPEKAFFDILYLASLGKLSFDFSSVNLHDIDIDKTIRYVNKYLKRLSPKMKRILEQTTSSSVNAAT